MVTVVMNTSWHFNASATVFVRPVPAGNTLGVSSETDGPVLWLLRKCGARKKKKAGVDDNIPCIPEPELTDKAFRKNWARLIKKIYEVDPLTCAKCQDQMRVIAFIHDGDVIRKILMHLNLWDVKRKPPARAHVYPPPEGPACR